MKKMITAVAALLLSTATFAQTATTTKNADTKPQAQRQAPTPEQQAKRETENINSITALGSAYDKVLAANTEFYTKKAVLKSTATKGTPRQMSKRHKGKN